MLVRSSTVDKVVPEVAKYGGTVMQTSMPKETENSCRQLLARVRHGNWNKRRPPPSHREPHPWSRCNLRPVPCPDKTRSSRHTWANLAATAHAAAPSNVGWCSRIRAVSQRRYRSLGCAHRV